MLQQRTAGLGRDYALPSAHEQGRAQGFFHVANARASCSECEMRALSTASDADRLDDVAKQAYIGEIEAHGFARLRVGLPSNSAKEHYADCLLSAKCARAIFAIDESSTARGGGLRRAATLVTNARRARKTERNNG